ncbi:archaeal conserved hypothetical protein [Thermoplasmatales archaeon BRNA1]|nr:archaeal conserved hypothetical protein [Thermoplasmatales archaeon BRNA1]
MSKILEDNKAFAEKLKSTVRFAREPVAIKLIREGEEFPACCKRPAEQMSHCQAVFAASRGECLNMYAEDQACHVGSSALGMAETPEKVATGEFHSKMGMHDSAEAAAKMISDRAVVPFKTLGEAVCPLKDADFVPDVVAFIDIPERCYWFVPLETAETGGRAQFSTSPFQCACEDVTAQPVCTGKPNISMGCFGCRKKTDMKPEEMAVGIPYARIPAYVSRLDRYAEGPMAKAKRD